MKKNSILLIILITLFKICLSNDCCFNSKYAYRNNQIMSLNDFDKLEQLSFNCSKVTSMSILELRPKSTIVLDNSLNLIGNQINSTGSIFVILLTNFKGFEINSNPFEKINITDYDKDFIWWSIHYSWFDFYSKNKLINEKFCLESNFKQTNFLSIIRNLDVSHSYVHPNMCPYVLKNSFIWILNINYLSSSFVRKNVLTFIKEKKSAVTNLNSTIYQLQLDLYRINLTDQLLNKMIFKKLLILDLNGCIDLIQNELFKDLDNLKMIRFRTQNMRKLFSKNNKWLDWLNTNVNVDLTNDSDIDEKIGNSFILVLYQSFSKISFYEYPNEDFCLFKTFPHKRLVMPRLKPTSMSKCTCTELFLIQYSVLFGNSIDAILDKTPSSYTFHEYYVDSIYEKSFSKCKNPSIKDQIQKCNFTKMLSNCDFKLSQINLKEDQFIFYVYDWHEMSNAINFLFSKYINLAFSILGILINVIILIILSDLKIFTDKMYFYLKINACFNIVYCLTLTIRFIIFNIDDQMSAYQINSNSIIYYEYIYLIVVKLIGNLAKTCSYISHASFALSRYITITNLNYSVLEKFNKTKKKIYFIIIILFSLLINLFVCFQFSIISSDKQQFQMFRFDASNFSNLYKQDTINDYKETFNSEFEYKILNILQYLKIVFSDLSNIILATIIDILLFVFVRNKIKQKKMITSVLPAVLNPIAISITTTTTAATKKKKKSSEQRISQMVILNGINFLLFRFPLALLSFYGFVFRYNKFEMKYEPDLSSYIICKSYRFCAGLEKIFLFLHLNSYHEFFIYFKYIIFFIDVRF